LTSDPYQASGGPGDPASWNRYAYAQGDPVGAFDPQGLVSVDAWGDEFLCLLRIQYGLFPTGVDNYLANVCRSAEYRVETTRLQDQQNGSESQGRGGAGGRRRVARDRCHDRNLALIEQLGLSLPGAPSDYLANGGLLWRMSQQDADALEQQLISLGWTFSTLTGSLHRNDVGGRNADFRSFSDPLAGTRSVQIVIGREQDPFGQILVYADSDLGNPLQDVLSWLTHTFFEVIPGMFGNDRSCAGLRERPGPGDRGRR
jgi:hypothetical protein